MFIRKLKNRSGSTSLQIISKENGRYKVLKTVGCATTWREIEQLESLAREEIEKITGQQKLFGFSIDQAIENVILSLENSNIRTLGPELIFGKIFNHIGLDQIHSDMFRHLVLSRLSFPLSKLKTCDYLYRYQGISLDIDAVYRFLDKLQGQYKEQVESICFEHTKKILGGAVSVVFYDMTTLYFEASDEDDLRKTGYSKDGKHQHPQIVIGLLVGLGGLPIGYDIFEGNTYEGHTLIPFLEKMSLKFNLSKPIVVADSGLLSTKNILALEKGEYEYILGGRIKNESEALKKQIIEHSYLDGECRSFIKEGKTRLIVGYSKERAKRDAYNRERGIKRIEKQVKTGKLTKANLNQRGYNKFLKMNGEISIEMDYQKVNEDAKWDGLKGYVTNSKLSDNDAIENYKNLWHIEKGFRMSKTDLKIRPVFHRLHHRIEAHLCIAFAAFAVYKELERVLYQEKSALSIKKAAEITHNMYQITYTLPESKQTKSKLLKMDAQQEELYKIVLKNF
jgi:transposase